MNITQEEKYREIEVFIPGHVPSLKNSKVKTSKGIFMSKGCLKYLRSLNIQGYSSSKKTVKEYKDQINKPNLFRKSILFLANELTLTEIDYPIILGFHFVRKTKAEFDFNNANQIILDLMTAHNLIEDDSMSYIIPQAYKKDDKWYSVDKNNPGVYIKIIKEDGINK